MVTIILLLQSEWHLPLLACLFILACLYIFVVLQIAERHIPPRQPLLFCFSLLLLFLLLGSPLNTISHLSFSFHMLQMSLLFFVFPPLLLAGIPSFLAVKFRLLHSQKSRLKSVSPIWSLSIFALLFFLYHIPFTLEYLSQDPVFHLWLTVLLLALSFHSWLPLISPVPGQRFHPEQKKRYSMLSGMLLMPACLFLLITALFTGNANPYLHDALAQLCLPAATTIQVLPPFFNSPYDRAFAGLLMLAIHKLSLSVTSRADDPFENEDTRMAQTSGHLAMLTKLRSKLHFFLYFSSRK